MAERTQKATAEVEVSINKVFENGFDTLIQKNNLLKNDSFDIISRVFVSLAKLDHVVFKVKRYKGVFDNKHQQIGDYHSCRFGKWVASKGKEIFGKTVSFKNIKLRTKKSMSQSMKL